MNILVNVAAYKSQTLTTNISYTFTIRMDVKLTIVRRIYNVFAYDAIPR